MPSKPLLPIVQKELTPEQAADFFLDLADQLEWYPADTLIVSVAIKKTGAENTRSARRFPHHLTMDEAWQRESRRSRADIPLRDDWVPYGRLWWQTLDACRAWYREQSQQRQEKIPNTDPQMRRYQRALHHLRQYYKTDRPWYNGDEVSMKGSAYPKTYGSFAGLVWFAGWRTGFLAVEQSIKGLYPQFTIMPPLDNPWVHAVAGILTLIAVSTLFYHAFKPWWIAGFSWWPSSQRIARVLQRLDF